MRPPDSRLIIKLCFRLDDPHASSDHALESAIFDLFARHEMPLCVAVLPFYPVPGSRSLLGASRDNMPHVADGVRSGRLELAQHGHSHKRLTGTVGKDPSEFAGVEEATQRKLVMEGRRQLEQGFGTVVTSFVPPWNSYDKTTARVLANAGYRFVSAGTTAPRYPKGVKPGRRLVTVPRTCTLKTLETAIEQAFHFRRALPAVVCVFHPDEFAEFRDPPAPGEALPFTNLRELQRKLAWVRSFREVSPCSMGDLAEEARETGKLSHVSDEWWFSCIPERYRYRLPQSILLRRGFSSLLPTIVKTRSPLSSHA